MRDDVLTLFAFDRWANRRVLEACGRLTAEQYVAEPVPGWSSVRSTILHIAWVTEFHVRTVAGDRDARPPTEAELDTLVGVEDAARVLERAYRRFDGLTLTPERLDTVLALSWPGGSANVPTWVLLRHVVMHSTYHRGQVASKLKRFGIEQPITDFFWWAIEQVPAPARKA